LQYLKTLLSSARKKGLKPTREVIEVGNPDTTKPKNRFAFLVYTFLHARIFFNRGATVAEFKPFASTDLMKFHKEFEVERDLYDYLRRLDDACMV